MRRRVISKAGHFFVTAFLLAFVLVFMAGTSYACCNCGTVEGYHSSTRSQINANTTADRESLEQDFWLDEMVPDVIVPAAKEMWDQIITLSYFHAEIVGMFFDAREQLDTQRSLQRLQARAHKDYIPSESLCKYGTMVKSLAASEIKSRRVPLAMAKRSRDRQTKLVNHAGSHGPDLDFETRRNQFQTTYCDPDANNGHLDELCASSNDSERWNRDINYTRTIDEPLTLDLDFTEHALTDTEEDVVALGKNLYANEIFKGPERRLLQEPQAEDELMNLRSVIAKRSVAEHSYNSILALKAKGTESSQEYLRELVMELGMPEDEANYYLSDVPSYYAQMEILTKKIHQDPAFITNLIDTPANVERQQAVMKSFELMQQRDFFESLVRSEMLLSVLLEMKIMEHQKQIQNRIDEVSETPRE